MNAPAASAESIEAAVLALGPGPLTEAALQAEIAPLFSRVSAAFRDRVYLANHSLGRPMDAMDDDIREGTGAWFAHMGAAWVPWEAEVTAFRTRLARLMNAARPDCVVPKTSAGQGLRAILNAYDDVPRVVTTRGEFDSLDVILREYARRGRIALTIVEARAGRLFEPGDIVAAIDKGADLVVVSDVIFNSGQRLEVHGIVAAARRCRAKVLLDVYHALGVVPLDVSESDVDFAVGGSYKYLRGGPGACFLYLHPRHLDGSLRTLDTGWFAKREPFTYRRPEPPQWGEGGDAFLESTPPVLPFFQARAGQLLTLALGVARVRAFSLAQQRRIVELLARNGVVAEGGREDRGAFVVIEDERAEAWASALHAKGIITDARGRFLRLCPDVLTTEAELVHVADVVGEVAAA